jgi:hypothetical protein
METALNTQRALCPKAGLVWFSILLCGCGGPKAPPVYPTSGDAGDRPVEVSHESRRKGDAGRTPPPPPPDWQVEPEFLDAYRAYGSPDLVILTYMLSGAHGTSDSLNEEGIRRAFSQRVPHYLSHPDIVQRSVTTEQLQRRFDVEEIIIQDQMGAAQLVGEESGGDVVIVFVLTRRTPGDAGGAGYVCDYGVYDVNRRQVIDTWSWDVLPEPGSGGYPTPRMDDYAYGAARRIRERFIKWASHTGGSQGQARRPWTLTFDGASIDQAVTIEKALRELTDVEVRSTEARTTSRGAEITTKVMFDGRPLDLATQVQDAIGPPLNMQVTVRDAGEGQLNFELRPRDAGN